VIKLTAGLLNLLKEKDLLGKRGPRAPKIMSLSISKLEDIANEIEQVIQANHCPVENPFYSHSASLSLGGGVQECRNLDCRLSRIDRLARFTLMYSDKVYIQSFFSKYTSLERNYSNEMLELIRDDFYNDLALIHEIQHILKKGYISFFAPETNFCFTCQAERFLGKTSAKKFSTSYKSLQDDILRNMSVTCQRKENGLVFHRDGPPPYFDHPHVIYTFHTPGPIADRPRIVNKIEEGGSIPLSKTLIRALDFHDKKAHEIAADVIHGIATSACLNTTFLTENEIHISFINSLHHFPEMQNKNAIAHEHLSSIVPFVDDVSIKDIIKLRQ